MRTNFDIKLEQLNQSLKGMGEMVAKAIGLTSDALVNQCKETAKAAIACDKEIDDMEKEIERDCIRLILRYQPVAKDLRMVSSALKMITDMERIGDQCSDISEITILLAKETYMKRLEHIPEMAKATTRMVKDAIDAFVQKDIELAREVVKYDTVVDKIFLSIKKELTEKIQQDTKNIGQAIDLLMVAKYFERIGDHAENIAEWVEYSVTGKKKKKLFKHGEK